MNWLWCFLCSLCWKWDKLRMSLIMLISKPEVLVFILANKYNNIYCEVCYFFLLFYVCFKHGLCWDLSCTFNWLIAAKRIRHDRCGDCAPSHCRMSLIKNDTNTHFIFHNYNVCAPMKALQLLCGYQTPV